MISGIGVSAYSVYSGQSLKVYGSSPISDVENNQKVKGAEDSKEQPDIEDTATISDEAKNLLANEKAADKTELPAEQRMKSADEKSAESDKLPAEKKVESKDVKDAEKTNDTKPKTDGDLTQDEQQEVQQLKARDAEVRAHEQAHIAAAAGLRTSAPSYDYQAGPDGKKYAVGGEVSVSFSSTGDPEKDIQLAETMRNAALAPAEPSGQDRSVAASAEKIIQEERQKLSEQQRQQKQEMTNSETDKTSAEPASTMHNQNVETAKTLVGA